MTSQDALWNLIHRMDWWLWGYKAIVSLVALGFLYSLDAPMTRLGWIGRMAALFGFILCALSPFNNAFGPFADIFVYSAFTLLIFQLAQQCRARHALEVKGTGTPLERALSTLFERPRK